MNRFLIVGSPKFNNYYIFSNYIDEYLPANSTIVTCGSETGTDCLAQEYCYRNNIVLEEYKLLPPKTMDTVKLRNAQIISYCNSAIIFNDNNNVVVSDFVDRLTSRRIPVIDINIRQSDNIDCNYECKNEYLNQFFRLCSQAEYSIPHLVDVSLAILQNDDVLQHLLDCNNNEFFKTDKTNMAVGFAYWMKCNEAPYIKSRLRHDERKELQKPSTPLEELAKIWNEKKHPNVTLTTSNLQVLKDFTECVADGNNLWIEASDDQVVKKNLWRTREQLLDEEDDPVNSYYWTKDDSNTVVFYRNDEFDNSPFKAGMWYFSATTLK